MNLLTNQQHLDIRAALRDVTDTFFTTPVTYRLHADEFGDGEMMNPAKPYTEFNLVGLPKYLKEDKDEVQRETSGAYSVVRVDVLFSMDNLITANLIDTDANPPVPLFRPEEDEFLIAGEVFKVILVNVEGFFQPTGVLVRVRGEKRVVAR